MTDLDLWICATCAVEHAERVEVCAICDDERQWVPAAGQRWTSLPELAAAGTRVEVVELEPDLIGLTAVDKVGIGQQSKRVRTPSGNLLWDPLGYVDDDDVARGRELGGVIPTDARAIVQRSAERHAAWTRGDHDDLT